MQVLHDFQVMCGGVSIFHYGMIVDREIIIIPLASSVVLKGLYFIMSC